MAAGAPNAPIASRKTNTDDARIAGSTNGKAMPMDARHAGAPTICAASSYDGSMLSSAAVTAKKMSG
jgi:hypothetical protein